MTMTPFMMAALLVGLNPDAAPMCFSSDVKKLCCPVACATKNSPKWTKANDVLRACMKSIGCGESESENATIGMKCECERG